MGTIDRSSPIPAYFQIASDLRQRILRGEWQIDEQVTPEAELATAYGVSRMTMRQALAELVKEGLLIRQRGSGTFVNPEHKHAVPSLSFPINFSLRLREMGLTPSSRILQRKITPAPTSEIANSLHIGKDDDVSFVKRLLLGNEQPIALNLSIFSYTLCPEITTVDLINNSISETLAQRFDLSPCRAEHWLEAVRASHEDAELLDTEPDAPLLLLTTQSYLQDGTPLEYSRTSWAGDRMRLSVEVVPLLQSDSE